MDVTQGQHPHQKKFVPYIPEPIIQDLLSRLPVKSLLRFHSVCRSWKGIMSELQFVKEHLERALQNNQSHRLFFIRRNRLFIESERNRGIDHGDFDDGNIVAVQLDLPFNQARGAGGWTYRIFGSCNGLVCLWVDDKIHLFNPSTRESKSILSPVDLFCGISCVPPLYCLPDDHIARPGSCFLQACGFGYDSCTDDYKVVVIRCPGLVSTFSVSLYSLREKYWETNMEFPYLFVSQGSERGTFLNGALHWLVCGRSDGRYHGLVAAFDLTTEQLRDIPLPDILSSSPYLVLGVIRERLCLFHIGFTIEYDDFWQMNVYGDSTSWTRFRISLSYRHLQPLRSGGDAEEVLMKAYERLIMYDRRSNTYREVKVDCFSTDIYFTAMAFADTLISPNTY